MTRKKAPLMIGLLLFFLFLSSQPARAEESYYDSDQQDISIVLKEGTAHKNGSGSIFSNTGKNMPKTGEEKSFLLAFAGTLLIGVSGLFWRRTHRQEEER